MVKRNETKWANKSQRFYSKNNNSVSLFFFFFSQKLLFFSPTDTINDSLDWHELLHFEGQTNELHGKKEEDEFLCFKLLINLSLGELDVKKEATKSSAKRRTLGLPAEMRWVWGVIRGFKTHQKSISVLLAWLIEISICPASGLPGTTDRPAQRDEVTESRDRQTDNSCVDICKFTLEIELYSAHSPPLVCFSLFLILIIIIVLAIAIERPSVRPRLVVSAYLLLYLFKTARTTTIVQQIIMQWRRWRNYSSSSQLVGGRSVGQLTLIINNQWMISARAELSRVETSAMLRVGMLSAERASYIASHSSTHSRPQMPMIELFKYQNDE